MQAYVTAMAVLENGRIACTGSYESVKKIAGPETKFVDLSGQFVTPVSQCLPSSPISGLSTMLLNSTILLDKSRAALQFGMHSSVPEALKNGSVVGLQGFMDPHVHVLSGGLSLRTPDLSAVQTVEELKQIIKAECGNAPPSSQFSDSATSIPLKLAVRGYATLPRELSVHNL